MTPSEQIDQLIAGLEDWRGELLSQIRECFLAADTGISEAWKWKGSPTWEKSGILAVANAHKEKVKVTFSHGASLNDPDKLFNAGLNGNHWRAIDLACGDTVNKTALVALIQRAIAFNEKK
ncbi:DUF1801 domain-containing protein [Enterobacteriaceae bacterium RIT691]|nr:DUF1801 domain-containing protein [Enterobacteriaceae bacterium RIT691]